MESKVIKVISVISVVIGFLLVVGTLLKWNILINPPEEWSSFYSLSKLKKMFGKRFLILFNYIVGLGLIILGMYFFISELYY